MQELTQQERQAIAGLQRVARNWPKSLWLFSASGSLLVMKCGPDGKRAYKGKAESPDPDYEVAQIFGIENDGGDF